MAQNSNQNEALCRRNALRGTLLRPRSPRRALLFGLPASSHRTRASRPGDEASFRIRVLASHQRCHCCRIAGCRIAGRGTTGRRDGNDGTARVERPDRRYGVWLTRILDRSWPSRGLAEPIRRRHSDDSKQRHLGRHDVTMPASAPRYDQRLLRAIRRLDDESLPIAEVWRRVGASGRAGSAPTELRARPSHRRQRA